MKKTSQAIEKWHCSDSIPQGSSTFNFSQFQRFQEVKSMDLVDQKALWDKISKTYFSILINKQGSFSFKGLFTIRLGYMFFKITKNIRLRMEMIVNDISCKPGLNKLSPILKMISEKAIEDELL